jgi:hypothetical protein
MFKDFFFGYIYYRLYHLNVNKGEFQGIPAVATISLVQMLLILDLTIGTIELFFDKPPLSGSAATIAYLSVIIYFALIVANHLRLSKRIEQFNKRWDNESPADRSMKGFVIFVIIALPLIPLMLVTSL